MCAESTKCLGWLVVDVLALAAMFAQFLWPKFGGN